MLKAPKKEKRKYEAHGLKPTYVDLTRNDVYQLCYDLDDEGVRRFTGKIGERVLVERFDPTAENQKEFHSCVVFGIGQFKDECTDLDKFDNQIRVWDEVRDQLYYIDLLGENLPYCLRVIKSEKIRRPQKREKNDYITRDEIKEIVKEIKHIDESVEGIENIVVEIEDDNSCEDEENV
jgi:hypothetical protein